MKKRILSLLLVLVMLLSLLPAGVLAAEGDVSVTLSGMHDAQVKSLKLYTYMDGVKGADDLLAEKTAADGAYTIDLAPGAFTLTPRYYEENVRLQLAGEQIGGVIGRRGETLDAIQYLASLVANRGEGEYIRLSIDSGNYREKRARTLEALARKLANQAVRTGRSITLEPMNPYERRIIHGAVSTVKGATSSSTGVEPNRRVVISSTVPPTGGKEGSREGGRGGRNGRGGNRRGNGGRGNGGRGNGGERRSRPAGERRPRLEDPPAIGGPVRREQAETAPKSEKSAVEQEILSANTGKRYGKIDI